MNVAAAMHSVVASQGQQQHGSINAPLSTTTAASTSSFALPEGSGFTPISASDPTVFAPLVAPTASLQKPPTVVTPAACHQKKVEGLNSADRTLLDLSKNTSPATWLAATSMTALFNSNADASMTDPAATGSSFELVQQK